MMRALFRALVPAKYRSRIEWIIASLGLKSHKLHLVFQPTLWCNYSCPYCDPILHEGPKEMVIPPSQWIRFFKIIPKSLVDFTGGESVLYPGFKELVDNFPRKHILALTTNLSYKPEIYERQFRRFSSITMSFHPHTAKFESFIAKASYVASFLPSHSVNIVAFPDQLDKMIEYVKVFQRAGLRPHIDPYITKYHNYSGEEAEKVRRLRKMLQSTDVRKIGYDWASQKPKLCDAGVKHFLLTYNGDIYTCMAGFLYAGDKSHFKIGNVFRNGFRPRKNKIHCTIACTSGCDLDHVKFKYITS